MKTTPSRASGAHRGVWSEYSGHCTGAATTVPCRANVICASGNANAAAMISARCEVGSVRRAGTGCGARPVAQQDRGTCARTPFH
ncbi:hypothetical protein DF030_26325 [Burkholderia cenocepacia]|nr:hypothetical protein DF030_26325 [Burkholderia cenocepacia]